MDGQKFEFIGRMDYKGQHLYVALNASCCYTGFDCSGGGEIFVCRDENIFLKSLTTTTTDSQAARIRQSLAEDGILLLDEEPVAYYDKYARMFSSDDDDVDDDNDR